MTKEELRNGNDINHRINELSVAKDDMVKVLKELELGSYVGDRVRLRIDSRECMINTKRISIFVQVELDNTIAKIRSLEEEFYSI